ncbi:uncharacterized protein LOC111070418 [Drosophila obscura]|uniref:uncharacterized protein LOC111070418 n=1 Tax=Drosophila obscura TaxID=7282 RepID=UPI001BB2ABC2|nr:uncharacterized protein LOC111070418 [Drosophila obscura]
MNCPVRFAVLLCLVAEIHSKFEFTNMQCNTLDETYAKFDYCFLKSVNRSYKYISLKVKLLQTPITNAKINAALYQRFSGYKPCLYNYTVDGCKFMKNPRTNPVANYFFGLFSSHTNFNHSCPYDHDIILDKLSIDFIDDKFTRVLPFPKGSYLFETHWYCDNIKRVVVKVHGTLS